MVNDIQGSVFRDDDGVMAYAVGFQEVAARTASFIDHILKEGATPGDLPIEQPTQIARMGGEQRDRDGPTSEPGASARRDIVVHLVLERVAPSVPLIMRDSVGFRALAAAQYGGDKAPQAGKGRNPVDHGVVG